MKEQMKTETCPTCGHRNIIKSGNRIVEQRRKAASALANHLAFSLNIPRTRELVFILGKGTEGDNHAAVAHWVMEKIGYVNSWPLPADEVHTLISDLERELSSILSDLDHGRFYV